MSGIKYSCIFCDDVRMEVNGKFSYIGVYVKDLNITVSKDEARTPALAKFFIVCLIQNPDKRKKYSIVIEQPGVDVRRVEIDNPAIESVEKAVFVLDLQNFNIPKSGEIKVFLDDGKNKEEIDRLKLNMTKE